MSGKAQQQVEIGQTGDFREEVMALLPDLYRAARALTPHPSDAEDLVHDACVKALGSYTAASLPDRAACRAWLRRILVNTFRDRYRRERRAPVSLAADGVSGDNVIELAVSAEPSPEHLACYTELEAATQAAMAALPADVRLIATLHLVNGLSYKEIATVAECPLGTVMSRLARARRVLRLALEPFLETSGNGDESQISSKR